MRAAKALDSCILALRASPQPTAAQIRSGRICRGELTAQWRADNPELISGDSPENGSAELLLAKIKAERDALKKIKKPKKKTAVSASSEKGTSK